MHRLSASHPGHVVRQKCLIPHQLSVVEAARLLGVSRQALTNLLGGRAGISPEMAVRLAKTFGGSDESWLKIQLAYDLAEVRARAHTITAYPLASYKREQLEPQTKLF